MRRIRWRALLWRWRYVVAVGLLALATLLTLQEVRPAPPPSQPVLVAATDLPAGHVIGPRDVTTETRSRAPAGALEPAAAVGARTAVAVPEGLAVVDSLLSGPGVAASAPPGMVVVPVHVADPAVLALLRPGDRVDLYQAPVDSGALDGEAELVAAGALVLALPMEEEAGGLLDLPAAVSESALIVAAIESEHASVLTGAAGLAPFRLVLTP